MFASNIKVEWDDAPVSRVTQVNKKIWNAETQTFDARVFVRVSCNSREQMDRESRWMQEQFGPAEYQGKWWMVDTHTRSGGDLWMSDSLATFWFLKNGTT